MEFLFDTPILLVWGALFLIKLPRVSKEIERTDPVQVSGVSAVSEYVTFAAVLLHVCI